MKHSEIVVGRTYRYTPRGSVRVTEKPAHLKSLVRVVDGEGECLWVHAAMLDPMDVERPSAAPGTSLTFALTETQAEDILRALEDRAADLARTLGRESPPSVPAAIERLRALAATFRARLDSHSKAAE